ncbi:MAG: hypothetical protein SOV82_08055, partial [[Ruminococcus] gnavus]|nr:hypothetical protein [Mediterraneibacter gnavus]
MKKRYLIYIILVWVILIIPFAGMTFWPTTTTSENTELAKWPKWKEDGTWNQDYLEEAGEYFEDHFAFRQYFVTANGKGNGYKLYLKGTSVPQGEFHISVITENSGQAKIVASK